jgi:hypothetical protein
MPQRRRAISVEPRPDGRWAVQTDGTQRASRVMDRKSDAVGSSSAAGSPGAGRARHQGPAGPHPEQGQPRARPPAVEGVGRPAPSPVAGQRQGHHVRRALVVPSVEAPRAPAPGAQPSRHERKLSWRRSRRRRQAVWGAGALARGARRRGAAGSACRCRVGWIDCSRRAPPRPARICASTHAWLDTSA